MTRIKPIGLRRKRQKKTNYRRRINLLKSGKKRLVIRKFLRNIVAQIIEYSPAGDKILASANSRELRKYGYNFNTGNITGAYLTGLLIGVKSKKKGVTEAILDMGFIPSTKGSRIYAAVKGAIDGGLKVPCSGEVMPGEDRIKGEHVKKHAESIKNDDAKYKKQFSSYLKNKTEPEKIAAGFEQVKNNIMKA